MAETRDSHKEFDEQEIANREHDKSLKLKKTMPYGWTGSVAIALATDENGNLKIDPSNIISDEAYGADWNGVTTIAPSKNAVYDKIEGLEAVSNPLTENLDFDGYQALDFVIELVDTLPDPALAGRLIRLSTDNNLYFGKVI